MGCFASTPKEPPVAEPRTNAQATPVTNATSGPVSAQPKAAETHVASIPRPGVMVSERDQAMLKLKNNRDDLQNSLKRLEVMKTQDDAYVKEYLRNGDRERARMLLRRKVIALKREKLAINSLNNVDTMIDTLETQESTLHFYEALKENTKAIKSLNEVLTVEAMEDAVGKYNDEKAYAAEVQRVLYSASAQEEPSEDEMKRLIGMAEEDIGVETNQKPQALGETTTSAAADEEDGVLAALYSADPTPSALPRVSAEDAAKAKQRQPTAKPATAKTMVGA